MIRPLKKLKKLIVLKKWRIRPMLKLRKRRKWRTLILAIEGECSKKTIKMLSSTMNSSKTNKIRKLRQNIILIIKWLILRTKFSKEIIKMKSYTFQFGAHQLKQMVNSSLKSVM